MAWKFLKRKWKIVNIKMSLKGNIIIKKEQLKILKKMIIVIYNNRKILLDVILYHKKPI